MKIKKAINIAMFTILLILLIGGSWYAIFGLTPYRVSAQELHKLYSYETKSTDVTLSPISPNEFDLTFESFDGELVYGRLIYPENVEPNKPVPILIGVHGMGRTYIRWMEDQFKGTDTAEQTDELTNMALQKGYAVLAIDARNHGKRKDLDYNIKDVMYDLRFWGNREPYEKMIIDSVKDHRVVLDWILTQRQFDAGNISVAGYSMGGQISLILATMDSRINKVLSIVPPASKDTVAKVSPLNFVDRIQSSKVWLVTADNDEYANMADNSRLYDEINVQDKHHIVISGEHVLPEGYYKKLEGWY